MPDNHLTHLDTPLRERLDHHSGVVLDQFGDFECGECLRKDDQVDPEQVAILDLLTPVVGLIVHTSGRECHPPSSLAVTAVIWLTSSLLITAATRSASATPARSRTQGLGPVVADRPNVEHLLRPVQKTPIGVDDRDIAFFLGQRTGNVIPCPARTMMTSIRPNASDGAVEDRCASQSLLV